MRIFKIALSGIKLRLHNILNKRVALSLVMISFYALMLSIISGLVLLSTLKKGISYDKGILILLAFFGLELYSFASDNISPARSIADWVHLQISRLILHNSKEEFLRQQKKTLEKRGFTKRKKLSPYVCIDSTYRLAYVHPEIENQFEINDLDFPLNIKNDFNIIIKAFK